MTRIVGFNRLLVMTSAASAMLLMLVFLLPGCGGGGNTGVFPLAGVWVANSGAGGGVPRVQHYPGAGFIRSGSISSPPLPLLTTPFVAPQDTLFDPGNNLWVVDGGNGTGTGAAVYKFSFNQVISLNSTPNPAPAFAIKALVGPVAFVFPQFAAFDKSNNVWVSDSAANAIFKFSAAQLALASGSSLTPAAVVVNPGAPAAPTFTGPLGIAFDSSGNLWVANNGGTTIVEITAAQLAAASGVTPITPNTVLTSTVVPGGAPTINNPWGILFDSSGNIWFTNEQLSVGACSGSVVEFASGTFTGPGPGIVAPAAKVTITQTAMGSTFSLCDPNGITMNNGGAIVVANAAGNSLAEYAPTQATTSGSPVPHTFIVGATTLLNSPTGLTFGPVALQ